MNLIDSLSDLQLVILTLGLAVFILYGGFFVCHLVERGVHRLFRTPERAHEMGVVDPQARPRVVETQAGNSSGDHPAGRAQVAVTAEEFNGSTRLIRRIK